MAQHDKKFMSKIGSVVENVKFHSESTYRSSLNKIEETADFTKASLNKAYAGIVGTYQAIKYAGLLIAMIVAPVPTIVAASILWMMAISLDAHKTEIDKILENRKSRKEFDFAVSILKKYGRIPKTAVVKTDLVSMEIDAVTGSVEGSILTGKFKGQSLNSLSDEDLQILMETAPTEETKSLLEAYSAYRTKTVQART